MKGNSRRRKGTSSGDTRQKTVKGNDKNKCINCPFYCFSDSFFKEGLNNNTRSEVRRPEFCSL